MCVGGGPVYVIESNEEKEKCNDKNKMSQANSKLAITVTTGLTPRNSSKKTNSFDFINEYYSEVMERLDKSNISSHSTKNGLNRLCHINSILESSNMLLCRACVDETKKLEDIGLDKDLDLCLEEVTNGADKVIASAFVQRFKRKRKRNNKC